MCPSFVRRFQLWWERIRLHRHLEDSTSFEGIATPFIPIVKMCFHPIRKIRVVYAVCSILMFICIICMLSITITNYLSHKTIFRVDQIAVTEGVQPPEITICLDEHRTTRGLERKLKIPPPVNWGILKGVTLPCSSSGRITWSSELHSVSAYIRAVAHFNVTLFVTPPGDISLTVVEQVPIPPDHICTTFKVNHSCFGENQFWKIVSLTAKCLSFF
ncbi:unnamed protein product [Rodentolepis nana]|uniref:Uncharacterized protein n=1 Tax=Rodentolepis nana TaxID=102285 RepID=A0A0R3TN79_RODNA|nr:unnamed protein product [Rodentolepis nana]